MCCCFCRPCCCRVCTCCRPCGVCVCCCVRGVSKLLLLLLLLEVVVLIEPVVLEVHRCAVGLCGGGGGREGHKCTVPCNGMLCCHQHMMHNVVRRGSRQHHTLSTHCHTVPGPHAAPSCSPGSQGTPQQSACRATATRQVATGTATHAATACLKQAV